ncbi:hypothetical protein FB45DRAFT_890315 [Roridomyces roridus]|uniref:Uncharacterized protein n=1 Tax=Roridomyces roridus TaxID=1738132 RepID=A0AAD7FZH2_9AGAR|nr:hypothetical protein FB45DRAFT_890315 [Roridomyces roridus]
MSLDATEPRLPRELERVIFELAALSRPVLIPELLLVASRVKEWIQPLLYHTLVFDSGDYTTPLDGLRSYNPASFSQVIQHQRTLAECARNLIFIGSEEEVQLDGILLACPRVQNLFVLWPSEHDKPNKATLDALPLRQLYCEIDELAPTTPFSRPFFSNISHLELFSTPNQTEWMGLVRLPRLTHLALNQYNDALCHLVLKDCNSLCLLVVLTPPGPHTDYSVGADPRFVMMELSDYIEDWQRGALHGHGYWARAEDFIAKRRAGHPPPDPHHPFRLV